MENALSLSLPVRRAPALGLLFVLWLGETLLAAGAIFVLAQHIGELLDPLHVAMRAIYRGDRSGGFVMFPIAALIVGGLQALVLRGVWPRFAIRQWLGAWVLGSIIAYAGGWSTFVLLQPDQYFYVGHDQTNFGTIFLALLTVGVLGLVIGLLLAWPQWAVLRAYVPHARWWITATVIAWIVSGLVLVIINIPVSDFYSWHSIINDWVPFEQVHIIQPLLIVLIPALLLGVSTGGTLLALLVQRPRADKTH